jgi:hypothetical protein
MEMSNLKLNRIFKELTLQIIYPVLISFCRRGLETITNLGQEREEIRLSRLNLSLVESHITSQFKKNQTRNNNTMCLTAINSNQKK